MRGVGGETKVVSPLLPIAVTRERGEKKKSSFFGSSWPNLKEEEGDEAIGHLR